MCSIPAIVIIIFCPGKTDGLNVVGIALGATDGAYDGMYVGDSDGSKLGE